ncbi:MAG: ACP S-malonyltransferase, partial [Ignavibacteria bacterium]|nr:ACP S-malonyltransferase [Ignavibacteria bacterium]
MAKKAFLFPGQGSQYVGMAKDLFEKSVEAREMIKTADDILSVNLSYIMFNGPVDELKQSEYTQPAIFLHSVVLASLIRTVSADAAAGHSLGEYSAYVASGSIQFHEAIKLVRTRGLAMQQAGDLNKGTMAAVIGLDVDKVNDICNSTSADGVVQCANFNSPGQVVISGSVEGVKRGMEMCKSAGAKIVKELVVSAAFHSPLMEPAVENINKAIDQTNFYQSKIPVYTNVTGKSANSTQEIKNKLNEQITAPVQWEASIRNMIDDEVEEFYEIGPGSVLQGLLKRINPDVKRIGID